MEDAVFHENKRYFPSDEKQVDTVKEAYIRNEYCYYFWQLIQPHLSGEHFGKKNKYILIM